MHKGGVSLERLYDPQNHFKEPVNAKTYSSTISQEQVNLGTKEDMKYVSLSTCFTSQVWKDFIFLFKQH